MESKHTISGKGWTIDVRAMDEHGLSVSIETGQIGGPLQISSDTGDHDACDKALALARALEAALGLR